MGIILTHDRTERPIEGLYAIGDLLLDDGTTQLLIQLIHTHPRHTDADLVIVEHLAYYRDECSTLSIPQCPCNDIIEDNNLETIEEISQVVISKQLYIVAAFTRILWWRHFKLSAEDSNLSDNFLEVFQELWEQPTTGPGKKSHLTKKRYGPKYTVTNAHHKGHGPFYGNRVLSTTVATFLVGTRCKRGDSVEGDAGG